MQNSRRQRKPVKLYAIHTLFLRCVEFCIKQHTLHLKIPNNVKKYILQDEFSLQLFG